MGEMVPFQLARANDSLGRASRTHLERSITDYFVNNFYITTSAFFTIPPFLCALMVVGADRIIFSIDYPYKENTAGREFLDSIPVSPADREKIAHGNVEKLLNL